MCGHGSRHKGKCLCPPCFNDDPDEIHLGLTVREVPGDLVYLREVQSLTWRVGRMLGGHPARNALVFWALSHGACLYVDRGDGSSDGLVVDHLGGRGYSRRVRPTDVPYKVPTLLPPVAAFSAHRRSGGSLVALAAVIANAESGTSDIEIGDVVVQDTSIGLEQGDHGLAFPWSDMAVPVMFVKYGDL